MQFPTQSHSLGSKSASEQPAKSTPRTVAIVTATIAKAWWSGRPSSVPCTKIGLTAKSSSITQPYRNFIATRPPPQKPAARDREQRRDHRSGHVNRLRREWFQHEREQENQIIERRRCMWRCARREIFEVVMTHHRSQMLGANSHSRHPRITIRIREIDMARDKNIFAIRAARDQNKRSKRDQLRKSAIRRSILLSEIRHPKSAMQMMWARQDSNLGPRDYESPALTAELQARLLS